MQKKIQMFFNNYLFIYFVLCSKHLNIINSSLINLNKRSLELPNQLFKDAKLVTLQIQDHQLQSINNSNNERSFNLINKESTINKMLNIKNITKVLIFYLKK